MWSNLCYDLAYDLAYPWLGKTEKRTILSVFTDLLRGWRGWDTATGQLNGAAAGGKTDDRQTDE